MYDRALLAPPDGHILYQLQPSDLDMEAAFRYFEIYPVADAETKFDFLSTDDFF